LRLRVYASFKNLKIKMMLIILPKLSSERADISITVSATLRRGHAGFPAPKGLNQNIKENIFHQFLSHVL